MNLKEYFADTGIPVTVFARKAKLTVKTIYNYLNGNDIYLSSAITISRTTNGKVSIEEIVKFYQEINS